MNLINSRFPNKADLAMSGVDVLYAAANELASNLAKAKDDLIKNEITKRLGHPNWQVNAVIHRLKRCTVEGQPQETWLLDDIPLIEIWPTDFKHTQGANTTSITANIQYRTYSQMPTG